MTTLPKPPEPGILIIEHPNRGTLVDQDYEPFGEPTSKNVFAGWRTKFSWSGLRNDAKMFYSVKEVRLALMRIHPTIRRQCEVRKYGNGWDKVEVPL